MGSSASDDTEFPESPHVFQSWRVVCAVSFLVHAAWGAIIPTLSLTLRDSLHLPWQFVVLSCAMLPLGIVLAMPILRSTQNGRFDCRLSLAICELLSAGIAMTIAWCGQQGFLESVDGRIVAPVVLGYGILLSTTASSLHELARRTAPAQPQASREWKLWGALGFVLPAWMAEFAASRLDKPTWTSFESLCKISGWAGICAVLVLLVARQRESDSRVLDEDFVPTARPSLGIGLAGVIVVYAVILRCHELWMPPFILESLNQYQIDVPLVLRLSVVVHVFELLGLYAIGRILSLIGLRMLLLLAASCWLGRSLVLGSMAQLELTSRQALLCLFAAQVLGGLGTVWMAGPIALLVGRDISKSRRGLGHIVGWMGFIGAVAVIVCGTLSAGLFDAHAEPWIRLIVNRMPPQLEWNEFILPLRGWSGVWLLSAGWSLLFFPCVLVARTRTPPRWSNDGEQAPRR